MGGPRRGGPPGVARRCRPRVRTGRMRDHGAGPTPPTPPTPPPPPAPVGGTEPLAAPAAPPARRKRTGLIAGLVAALVVIGGLAFGAIEIFNTVAGTSDVLAKMVPADADVYVTAYLDPSASQKLNLRSLANKFPSAGSGGGSLSSTLDQ